MMSNLIRSNFQAHPFHLVSPSLWPVFTALNLLSLTTTGVLSMHGFSFAYVFFFLALTSVIYSMGLWFRDIISEGKFFSNIKTLFTYNLNTAKVVSIKDIEKALIIYKANNYVKQFKKDDFGYYLAGLLEGDGHISIPALGFTVLNRVLNPRIVFTSHINNLGLYAFIQSQLGNCGRFQKSGTNIIRFIIGDKKGIILFINLVHSKLRTPKNKRFNDLVSFVNEKYCLNINKSLLDISSFKNNSWFAGFTEADGHFGIKYVEKKVKSGNMKRSVSENVSLKFRLDQRLHDKPTGLSMRSIMESLALFLNCSLKSYKTNNDSVVLSLSVQSIHSIKFLISYFNNYPLLGDKLNDFKKWEVVYNMILSKEHLTERGINKIKSLIGKFS
jgi:hypothetical protein